MKPDRIAEAFGQFNAFHKYNAKKSIEKFPIEFFSLEGKNVNSKCANNFFKPEKQKSDSIMRTKQMIYVMAFYGKTNVNLIISFFLLSF